MGIFDIAAWLEGLGLARYAPAFAEHGIDGEALAGLTDCKLTTIGVLAAVDRQRILAAAARRRGCHAGGRRQLTVMFVELIGYTGLTSRLDPEELCGILRRYQSAMAAEVGRFEGVVANFLGDGVLAYFGYPQAHEDDAERAVSAGLAIIAAASHLTPPDGEPLRVRIGIATGLVVVGHCSGGLAHEWSAVGETPTLAARLQELASPDTVLVADATRQLTDGLFVFTDAGELAVKGFEQPVRAWQVQGRSTAEGRFEARQALGRTPIVGRAAELAHLRELWRDACNGAGRVALIRGEPGIGKSRLVHELREELRHGPHIAVHCRCSPFHTARPLHPVIDEVARAAQFAVDDDAAQKLGKLERLLAQATDETSTVTPLFAELLAVPTEAGQDTAELPPPVRRERTLEALVGQLEGLARREPVLLVLEDAHWADPTTLELFGRLIERAPELRVLIVVTSRERFEARRGGEAHVFRLGLCRLDAIESQALVHELARGGALSEAIVAQLVAKADGVPLFVEELTRAALARPLGLDSAEADIPATLQDSLVARLDRLADVREVAQTAACLGREFDHELMAAVTPLPASELDRALGRLAAAGILLSRGRGSARQWRFNHALVRDAAYATLLHQRRRELHAAIVAAMEGQFPDLVAGRPDLLAQHCAEAGLIREAIDYWHRAGLAAAQRSAMQEAVVLLRRGLDLVQHLPDPRDWLRRELDLQLALGAALLALKGEAAAEIEQAYGRARVLSRQLGNEEVEAAVLWGLWHNHANRAELAQARAVVQEQVLVARRQGEGLALAVAHRCGLVAELFSGAFAAALAHHAEVEKVGAAGADQPEILLDPWISGHSIATWPWLITGRVDEATAASRSVLATVEVMDRPYLAAVVMHHQNVLNQLLGDSEAVARGASASLQLTEAHGFAHWHATATLLSGWAAARHGDLAGGIATMRRGLEAKRATGSRLKLPYYQALLAELLAEAGDAAAGLALVDDALAQVAMTGERWFEAELHRHRAGLLLAAGGRRSEAELAFHDAMRVAQRQQASLFHLRAVNALARLWVERGERGRAGDHLAPATLRAGPMGPLPEAKVAQELLTVVG